MLRLTKVFFAPEDSGSGAGPIEDKSLNVHELADFLKDDEEEPEQQELIDLKPEKVEKPAEDDDDDDEETTELAETDEDDELETLVDKEPDEEDLELVTPVKRRDILAKYPNIFKEFPYLERAYYREQKYTELFATIPEAEQALDKARTWDKFEGELSNGDLGRILSALYDHDKNTFYKVSDTILDVIHQIDSAASIHVQTGIAKRIISLMVDAGKKPGQEGLVTAATLMHQFLFGARDWEPHQPMHKAETTNPNEDRVAARERAFLERQFNTARLEITSRIENTIKATIERNIDPKDTMTAYVKSKAVDDVLKDVQSQIKEDKRFQKILVSLWQQGLRKEFNEESKTAIRSAVMTRAKQLLLPAIQKGRRTALGTAGKRRESKIERPEKTGPDRRTGNSTSPMSGKGDKNKIPSGMSTKDYLMKD